MQNKVEQDQHLAMWELTLIYYIQSLMVRLTMSQAEGSTIRLSTRLRTQKTVSETVICTIIQHLLQKALAHGLRLRCGTSVWCKLVSS